VEVAFFQAPSLEPAPGPASAAGAAAPEMNTPAPVEEPKAEPRAAQRKPRPAKPEKPAVVTEEKKVETKPLQTSAPATAAAPIGSAPAQSTGGGVPSGTAGLVKGAIGGQNGTTGRGAQLGSAMGTGNHRYEVLPFGPGMTRPRRLAGRDPAYTRAALMARVEGTVLVQCEITLQGRLQSCRIVKGQPHMERAVLDALATHRYTPVMYQGRTVAVRYIFNIRLVLPE
ncbi:MAG TPA: TonB family protein, partial [Polyangiaceae bacterium]|nr:TonB family protein [Polyangiaceae bacterium]